MTYRTRILLACLLVALVPLIVLGLGARREVRARLGGEFEARVAASSDVIQQDLARVAATLDARLRSLAERAADDAMLRAALLGHTDRSRLVDYAPDVLPLTGLDFLLLLDADATVLSAGHFRSDIGRSLDALPALRAAPGPVLVATRRAPGPFLALVRAHTFAVGGRRFALLGGVEVDATFVRTITRDTDGALLVTLEYPGGSIASNPDAGDAAGWGGFGRQIALPFLDELGGAVELDEAQWTITHSLLPLRAAQRGIDAWFAAAGAAAVLLAFVIARLLAARVTRPLEELARRTTRVNLDRGDVQFAMRRRDEIGTLARMLDAMVQRLRTNVTLLRDAERRATVGDMARQVNHDVRNGLLPIRNVISHLGEVARETPEQLGEVFAEREATLRGGIGYLESLATSYARLSPRSDAQPCDVNEIVRTVAEEPRGDGGARVRLDLAPGPLRVTADPVALRRIIENLIVNAIESLESGAGGVTVSTRAAESNGARGVAIRVTDTGKGIEPEALDLIFNDFYTTKERGTGLGLSIVRRLVGDMGGRIGVESRPGAGTTFHVELPESS